MDYLISFGSADYWLLLGVLIVSRALDFLSTWIATPTLLLEANPLARKFGWQGSAVFNVAVCIGLAIWPMLAIAVTTMNLLVTARNFQTAWLMRTFGEENYRDWYVARVHETRVVLYLLCLAGHTLPTAVVGVVLMIFSPSLIPFSIGFGMVIYSFVAACYILFARWRLGRRNG